MKHARRRALVGLAFVAPALLFVAVFVLYPLAELFRLSLTSSSLLGGEKYVGWSNYIRAWNDETFWNALLFTLKYTAYITPILIVSGFLLALLTLAPVRLAGLTRTVVFLPFVIGIGSSSFLWVGLFDEQVGLVDRQLQDLHLVDHAVVWFVDAELGLWAVIVSIVWKVVGFGMILFVAAIQSVGEDIQEAATMDGAGYWQRVLRITLPLTGRAIAYTTLVSAIGSMLAFDQFYIMTAGGPRSETFTSVYWIYQNSFIYFKQGYGATLSIILLAIIFAAAAVQIFLARRTGQT
ncbi:MAG TPA: sugar ABC transporter permease [Burkholderiaceae bacterium]|nr:sugar ABC transporter permease [Burkholderiaceae bacterium]